MVEQNEEMNKEDSQKESDKPFSVVAVSVGKGLQAILESLGVDHIIEGGQTLNPSTEDIVKAINKVKGKKVIILPNNSNIILAAEQAKSLVDKEIVVIPSKSIPQGIVAMISLDQKVDFEIAVDKMNQAIKEVITGEVTYAVRNSHFDGQIIEEGDILGLADGKVKVVEKDKGLVLARLLKEMIDKEKELVTIYYGQEVSKEEAENVLENLEQEYPDVEFEMHYGGQPLYYYLLSAE